jgi:cyclic-di-GMP phosphodiesterase TipF (flagellum assembly factor)
VQGLVYIFIALATLGVAAAAYFGLTFSPIEAFVTAIAFGAIAVMLMERRLRQRSEARLERAVEDLARLLSTDAKAGQVLSQRVNAIADTNVGSRLDGIEADISVLGTVTRQLAEALAEFEEARRADGGSRLAAATAGPVEADDDIFLDPMIPEAELRAALDANRLVFHIEPIVRLPARKPLGYDLVPRLMQDAGGLADAPDFMPRRGGEDLIRRIEAMALDEAVTIARRARTSGQPITLFLPLSRATILDKKALEQVTATLVANQAITASLNFAVRQTEWKPLGPTEKRALYEFRKAGAGFVLTDATSLRFDFAELEGARLQRCAVRCDPLPVAAAELHRLSHRGHRALCQALRDRALRHRGDRRAAVAEPVRRRHQPRPRTACRPARPGPAGPHCGASARRRTPHRGASLAGRGTGRLADPPARKRDRSNTWSSSPIQPSGEGPRQ